MGATLLSGAAIYVLPHTGPLISHSSGINLVTAGVWTVLATSGTLAFACIFKAAANISEYIAARTPTGIKGNAKWATSAKDLGKDAIFVGYGAYWGAFETKRFLRKPKLEPVFSNIESNALIAAPAGAGKLVTNLVAQILSIDASMGINDLKTEIATMLKRVLEEKGFDVHVLNYGGRFKDRIGPTDSHNGLNLVADCFIETGRILEVANISNSMGFQLIPKSAGDGNGDADYFKNGGRDILEFAIIVVVITLGMDGNLADVNILVSDRDQLLEQAQWVCGKLPRTDGGFSQLPFKDLNWYNLHPPEMVDAFIEYLTSLAAKIAGILANSDSKSGESFLSEAQQAVSLYHRGTTVYEVFSHSSFRFKKMKDGARNTVVFFCLNSADLENQTKYAAFDQWCMLYELKRHKNLSRKVHFLCDEATNFYWADFASQNSILTWGRSSGIIIYIYIQSLAAWVARYGKEAKEILLSETQIKLFLPGQRDPETLALIVRLLGKCSKIIKGRRGSREKSEFNIDGIDWREEAVDMMSETDIRQTDKSIAFIHQNDPALLTPVRYPEVDIWQNCVDENPYHEGQYILPTRMRVKWDRRPMLMRIKQFLTFWRR